MSDTHRQIAHGLARLDELYVEAIAAYAPPNPQFERNRIIMSIANKRELAYVCGFLSEGENETALIVELMREMLEADPGAEIGHLVDEAWYYLRTSIDATWQLDPNPPQIGSALNYLAVIVKRRVARVAEVPFGIALADSVEADARELLNANVENR